MLYTATKISFVYRYKLYFLCSLFLNVFFIQAGLAQSNNYSIVRTPKNVTVNRAVPAGTLAPDATMPAHFSKNPTDEEIFRVHFFEEPLVPSDADEISGENTALVYALAGYSQRTNPDDFSSIINFLKRFPNSRWRGALLADLGIIYRRTGYYNQALNAWEQAWNLLKDQHNRKAKLLADRAISELLLINAWVGRQEIVDSLLSEIDNRVMEGPAGPQVLTMRRAQWLMKNRPGTSFMCGPYALSKLYAIADSTKEAIPGLESIQSSSRGFSLAELQDIARNAGMHYRMAYREPGAVVIPNAVVHWKLNHYSALLYTENGHYKCSDATVGTTYGQEFWLTPAALDSSASGYFLVPEGLLPNGWRPVLADEGNAVFGKGQVPPSDKPTSPDDPQEPGCSGGQGMAKSNVHVMAVSLHIYDQPIFYTPPVGPAMIWNMDYHQRDSYQPSGFAYSNFGFKWTFNWLSYIQDNPTNLSANVDLYVMGGGVRTFTGFSTATQSYAPEVQTKDVLVRICPTCYELRHPDGSKEVYARSNGSTSNGRKIFLTRKVDAAGNAMNIGYDANLRITSLKDTIGQVTTIYYENSSDIYKITRVTDPFNRSATFNYDASGRLISITDMIGIVSSFKYDASDFITAMTTPYGTTTFIKEDGPGSNRAIETRYPLGERERVEFAESASGISSTEPVVPAGMSMTNQYMQYRNTFYWDKKAMKEAPGDYTKAKIYHWLHGNASTNEDGTTSPLLESIKQPLENRVWYRYENQASSIYSYQNMSSKPSLIGRVMDDGTTQIERHYHNARGADTLMIDQVGRRFTYKYDSTNINLLEVRQTRNGTNELLAKFTYNARYQPLTSTDASGQTTTFTYSSLGQVLTIKNAKNETTTFNYNGGNYLQSITGPIAGSNVSFTYDGYGRMRTVTDSEGYTVTTDYDALDRPTLITYPDSSHEQIVYDRMDAVHRKDRLGRWSHTTYDSLDRPNIMQDALGRVTQMIWCSCGSLAEIIDPLKQTTSFVRDLQGRIISKIFHDGKSISYKYENTISRLKEVTDAKGQKTQYSYFADDNVKKIDYVNAQVATPSVSYTYDTAYNRVSTMTDGTGATTYAYKPVGSGLGSAQLASVDGPLLNDVITYGYDEIGRTINRSINGVTASIVYDSLDRVTNATNALGSFGYNYANQTQRLASVDYPNGQNTSYDYFNNNGNQRLKQIWNKIGATTLSKFDYEYNKEGQITRWTQQAGTATPTYYDLGYDDADQLTSATQKNESTATIIKRYAYQYDKGSNRTSEQIDNTVTSSVYNNVNQLTRQIDNGPIRLAGSIDKFSNVHVRNLTTTDSAKAVVDTLNGFEAFVKTVPGTNNIAVTATDFSGNSNQATNNYNITINTGTANTLLYDNNGNTISTAVPNVLYDWDAKDRLVKITAAYGITEFIYDGLDRRVAEKLNGTIIKKWLWDGTAMVEERDASGSNVIKRFFNQGEHINGTNYYFAFDHLGSVREMTDGSGVVRVRYDYDPYGKRTRVFGSMDADFGFTGHYYHAASSLHLTLYRAYDANIGRWLSKDPIKNMLIMDLYRYVNQNPINYFDPLGLWSWKEAGEGGANGAATGAGIGAGIGVGIGGFFGGFPGAGVGAAIGGAIVGALGAVGGFIGGGLSGDSEKKDPKSCPVGQGTNNSNSNGNGNNNSNNNNSNSNNNNSNNSNNSNNTNYNFEFNFKFK